MTASSGTPPVARSRWKQQTLAKQAGLVAVVLVLVALVLTIALSVAMPLFVGLFVVAFAALVVYLATSAAIFYLAYRFGIDIVRQGILAAEAERARRKPDASIE